MSLKELKKIGIVDFCNQNGIALNQDSNEYYRLVDHDSCVISDKKNLFKWNSRNLGGDTIDFVKAYYNCSFLEAKSKLTDTEFESHEFKNSKPREKFNYNQSKNTDCSKAKDYLINTRRISEKLVKDLLDKELITQDEKGNINFLWKTKNNQIVGCTEQGTTQFYNARKEKMVTWKKIQENSKEHCGFKVSYGSPNKMYFFESEIDLMSYVTQFPESVKDSTMVSMNGLKVGTVLHSVTGFYNQFKKLPEEIYLCVDNDEAGRTFVETEFNGKGIGREGVGFSKIINHLPSMNNFDWNDNLTKSNDIMKLNNRNDMSSIIKFAEEAHVSSKVNRLTTSSLCGSIGE